MCGDIRRAAQALYNIFDYYEKAKTEANPTEQNNARWKVACNLERWAVFYGNHQDVKGVAIHSHVFKWCEDNNSNISIESIEPWLIDDVPSFEERTVRIRLICALLGNKWTGEERIKFSKLLEWLSDSNIKTFYDWFTKHPKIKPHPHLSAKNLREMRYWLSKIWEYQRDIDSMIDLAKDIINTVPTSTSTTQTEQAQETEHRIPKVFQTAKAQAAFKPGIDAGLVNATDLSLNSSLIDSDNLAFILAMAISDKMGKDVNGRFSGAEFKKIWGNVNFRKAKQSVKDGYSVRGEERVYSVYGRASALIERLRESTYGK